jgi:molybdopterin/thiamine biosynthesis adenylyltransferase
MKEPSIYDRQDLVFDRKKLPDQLYAVGAGGVGWWAAFFAAMAGVPEIILGDYDKIDETNRGRLPVTNKDVGEYKTEVLKREILDVRPDCRVICVNEMFSGPFLESMMSVLSPSGKKVVVLSAVDKSSVDDEIREMCKKRGIKYVRCGVEGNLVTFFTKANQVIDLEPGSDGYTIVPSWVGSSAMAGVFAASLIVLPVEVTPREVNIDKIIKGEK